MKLKQYLKNKLTKTELEKLRASYDVIGDIAIIEIPKELVKKQKIIGNALLKLHKQIKTVVKKKGGHVGRYRTQPVIHLVGERKKTTTHIESGLRFDVDVEKAYFSPRLVTERMRIANLVKRNENVLVMFSGVAPYPLVIAKHSKANHVTGIEINPKGHELGLQNIIKNKLESKITLIKGNARFQAPKLKKFDRIVMPLPKTGEKYLDVALSAAKPTAQIHLYVVATDDEVSIMKKRVLKACSLKKKQCRILRVVRCGQLGVRTYRFCIDFKLGSRVR